MKTLAKGALSIAMACSLFACGPKEYDEVGVEKLSIFEEQAIAFRPGTHSKELTPDENGVIYLADGRLLLKKVAVPNFDRNTRSFLDITLASGGDRWDKSGSCFIIPASSEANLLSIAKGEQAFPKSGEAYENLAGIVAQENYKPVVELMRFMTPFGVGFYNDQMELRRPPYIPVWEDNVTWQQETTDLLCDMEGEVYVGIWIDTWTDGGYVVDVNLTFEETHVQYDAQVQTQTLALVNTIPFMGPQSHPDIFSRQDLTVEATVPEGAKNVRLKYIVTGHGGHSGGDEFVKKRNIVSVDGKEVLNFIPWRDDCASFRRFNPGTGVWFAEDREGTYIDWESHGYKTTTVKERVGSSDLSRSNWCPGSDVTPEEIALENIEAGSHTFNFSIPEATPAEGDKLNHWLVSAYLVYEIE